MQGQSSDNLILQIMGCPGGRRMRFNERHGGHAANANDGVDPQRDLVEDKGVVETTTSQWCSCGQAYWGQSLS